ncbi:MAG: SDR family oxidoreductase [Bacteroidota bacterium]
MNSSDLLKNKVCLITGAGTGIGKAIAERYAECGAIVYANGLETGSIDEWAVAYSKKTQSAVIPVYFDITDFAAVKQAVMQIKKDQQHIDVLVNNAGVVTYEFLSMINFDSLRNMFEVNVIAMIHLIQLVSRVMSRQNSGSVINISSIVGVEGAKGQLAYSATKGAVISLTKSAAKELASQNIRVNAIAPGMVDTERFRAVFEKSFNDRISDIGMGRLAKPEEIADACVFLGSDMSTYVSGQILGVNGSTVI